MTGTPTIAAPAVTPPPVVTLLIPPALPPTPTIKGELVPPVPQPPSTGNAGLLTSGPDVGLSLSLGALGVLGLAMWAAYPRR